MADAAVDGTAETALDASDGAGRPPTAPAAGGVGGDDVDALAGTPPPALGTPAIGGVGGAAGEPSDATVGAVDAAGAEPPAAPAAAAPCAAPTAKAAAVLAVVVTAVSRVIIVPPTSPLTIRLEMNGINAMEIENKIAVIASRII